MFGFRVQILFRRPGLAYGILMGISAVISVQVLCQSLLLQFLYCF